MEMSLWMSIVLLLGLIKLPIAALMLWMPFRNDEAMHAPELPGDSDEDGGSRTLPAPPRDPSPRWPGTDRPSPVGSVATHPGTRSGAIRPRRGPHPSPPPPSPRRVRTAEPSRRRVPVSRSR